jgi:hypothetical protein
MTTTKTSPTDSLSAAKTEGPDPVLVDLGRKSRKQIKRLRKGEGKLWVDVATTIEQLKADGIIAASATAPVVVVVVERKAKKGLIGWN